MVQHYTNDKYRWSKCFQLINNQCGLCNVYNELPVWSRWANVVLGGLWFSKGHPEMAMFLEEIILELNIGTREWKCGDLLIQSKLQVVCACIDVLARSTLLNSKKI